MKIRFLAAAAVLAGAALFSPQTTQAALVSLEDLQLQTQDFQLFTFTFTPVAPSDGTDGLLLIHAFGDYTPFTLTEFTAWQIESFAGPALAGPNNGASLVNLFGTNAVEWVQGFVITGSDLVNITNDGLVEILVALSGEVHVGFSLNEYVQVALIYNAIPEPSTWLLFGAGLAGLVFTRRRNL